jgi:hypothetical protein
MVNNSRRRFLTRGTGVAASLLGVASLPQAAVAASNSLACDAASGSGSVYYPNDSLVKMIAKAWAETDYKKNLLTFPEVDKAPEWNNYTGEIDNMLGRTKKAFEDENIYLDCPIVLTPDQFANYARGSLGKRESLFVLPELPLKKVHDKFKSSDEAVKTAQVAMVFCVFGM